MSRKPDLIEILPPDLPPMAQPTIVFGDRAIVQHPLSDDNVQLPLLPGMHVGWQPLDGRGVLLALFFGPDGQRGVVTTLSGCCLGRLIADLQSIERQL
jgi:hypothetical protein